MAYKDIRKTIESTKDSLLSESTSIMSSSLSGYSLKSKVIKLIDHLRKAMYPEIYMAEPVGQRVLGERVYNELEGASVLLYEMLCALMTDESEKKNKVKEDGCYHEGALAFPDESEKKTKPSETQSFSENKIEEITSSFISSIPDILKILKTDVEAAYEGDPAAKSTDEVMFAYPAFNAISIYRLAHLLYDLKVPLIPRMMTEYAHQMTGIDIHPGAKIGPYFFIDHATGVVIGETCVIGGHVKLYQGVTLGAKSFKADENGILIKGIKRHPNIGNNVVIYSGATILGNITVGDGCTIGGNVWLTHSVKPGSVLYYDGDLTKNKSARV